MYICVILITIQIARAAPYSFIRFNQWRINRMATLCSRLIAIFLNFSSIDKHNNNISNAQNMAANEAQRLFFVKRTVLYVCMYCLLLLRRLTLSQEWPPFAIPLSSPSSNSYFSFSMNTCIRSLARSLCLRSLFIQHAANLKTWIGRKQRNPKNNNKIPKYVKTNKVCCAGCAGAGIAASVSFSGIFCCC